MKTPTWLAAFDHALEAIGVAPEDRASALVETEGFLAEAGVGPFEHFGPPADYAAELAAALGEARAGAARGAAFGADDHTAALVVDGVSRSYGGRRVLDGVSLTVEQGEVVALIGPNGTGKSTLLRIAAGLEPADDGSVIASGAIGYVPQSDGLDPYLRPSEHFELFGAPAGLDREAARSEGNRLARELGWDAAAAPVAGKLSGGTAQKLAVITALLGRPEVLLLDEPYQGMDADSQQRFWAMLWSWRDDGRSALVSSHAPDVLAKASKVIEIDGLPVR
ncbi:MAG: ATP-binding cassette domain-containing protein [Actinomycetota bacterium]